MSDRSARRHRLGDAADHVALGRALRVPGGGEDESHRPVVAEVGGLAGEATGPVGFLRVYDKAFGEIAQGGCLLPETLVFTERGLLRLDEIADKQQAGWQEHNLQVATDEGWRPSPRAFNNGVAPVLRVHTQAGVSLAGTPEHRVKVMTGNGPEWRMLKDLRRGDWVVVQLGQVSGGGYLHLFWMFQRTMFGKTIAEGRRFPDLKPPELVSLIVLSAGALIIGIYPGPLLDMIEPASKYLLDIVGQQGVEATGGGLLQNIFGR